MKASPITESITTDTREAAPMAHEAVHDTVVNILRPLLKGKLLDVPTGEGALAKRLLEIGFDVSCSDLYTEIFRLRSVEIKRGNLDGVLPYEDDSFGYIVCVEGLEHIENPQQAMREFRRILKSNGHLIVSVPNIMNIEERLKWLINGYTSHFKPLSQEHLEEIKKEFCSMEEIALHANPISYSELRYVLEKNNFVIQKLYLDKAKKNSWAYLPFVWLIRLISHFSSKRKRKERWANELNSNEVLLGGNTLIVHAIKQI